ncbi:MAG: hypothetical protein ABI700_32510, partial [Chloroflexota bacterium]
SLARLSAASAIEDAKFDALVEYNSIAAENLREAARKVVAAYIEHSNVIHSFTNPIEVPAIKIGMCQGL